MLPDTRRLILWGPRFIAGIARKETVFAPATVSPEDALISEGFASPAAAAMHNFEINCLRPAEKSEFLSFPVI
jgi:hypothetical protein